MYFSFLFRKELLFYPHLAYMIVIIWEVTTSTLTAVRRLLLQQEYSLKYNQAKWNSSRSLSIIIICSKIRFRSFMASTRVKQEFLYCSIQIVKLDRIFLAVPAGYSRDSGKTIFNKLCLFLLLKQTNYYHTQTLRGSNYSSPTLT